MSAHANNNPADTDIWSGNQREVAKEVLDTVLETEVSGKTNTASEPVAESEDADQSEVTEPVLNSVAAREQSRVLFVTENTSVLEKDSTRAQFYTMLSDVFDEVHVLVLQDKVNKKEVEPRRVNDNVWFYSVSAPASDLLSVAMEYATKHLVFGEVFRPDIIVSIDPKQAGIVSLALAENYSVPTQLHLTQNWWKSDSENNHALSWWQRRKAWRILKQFGSIRTNGTKLLDYISKHTKGKDAALLPTFHGISQLKTAVPSFAVHEKYPEFKFIMVTMVPLTADSQLHDVFTTVRPVLLHNRIGLVVIGSGPAKDHFVEKAKLLGIAENVIFVPADTDIVPYFKTADLLIDLATGEETDERTLQSIAANLPLLGYVTPLREDLLEDRESAYLPKAGDLDTVTDDLKAFINSQGTRITFKTRLEIIAEQRIKDSPETFLNSYRASIETVLSS